MQQSCGFFADEVDAAAVVDVVDVVPGDALCSVFLLQGRGGNTEGELYVSEYMKKTCNTTKRKGGYGLWISYLE